MQVDHTCKEEEYLQQQQQLIQASQRIIDITERLQIDCNKIKDNLDIDRASRLIDSGNMKNNRNQTMVIIMIQNIRGKLLKMYHKRYLFCLLTFFCKS